jgi:hypothetical protein
VVGGVVGAVAVVVHGGDEGFLILCHRRGCFDVLVLFLVLKFYLKNTQQRPGPDLVVKTG